MSDNKIGDALVDGSLEASGQKEREKPSRETTDERPENSVKATSIQAQEEPDTQNPVASDADKAPAPTPSFIEQLLAENPEEIDVNWGRKPVKKANDAELRQHLKHTCSDLNDLMGWKEELRLLGLSYSVPSPYYDSWTKEANLFFRRLVIINRRLETLKKQKRA